jgi:hypothetical protein
VDASHGSVAADTENLAAALRGARAVEDTGTGLDPTTADRIFDPFFGNDERRFCEPTAPEIFRISAEGPGEELTCFAYAARNAAMTSFSMRPSSPT